MRMRGQAPRLRAYYRGGLRRGTVLLELAVMGVARRQYARTSKSGEAQTRGFTSCDIGRSALSKEHWMADGRSRFMMVDAGGHMQGDGRQMTTWWMAESDGGRWTIADRGSQMVGAMTDILWRIMYGG